jgi:hypothetical protein
MRSCTEPRARSPRRCSTCWRTHADEQKARQRSLHAHPCHALEVADRRADDLHARVGIIDPVDGDFVNAEPVTLREDEQLGVEEPSLVLDRWQQSPCYVGANGLEAALSVRESCPKDEAEQMVIGTRDELALAAANDTGTAGQAAANCDVAVAGDQPGDQRQQCPQVGREIHVHVAEDLGSARRPRRTQSASAPLGREVEHLDAR